MTLFAIILTKNEAKHIAACIDSVRWADGTSQDFPVPPLGAYHTLRR